MSRVELGQADGDIGGTPCIAGPQPTIHDGAQLGAGFGEQALTFGTLRQTEPCVLIPVVKSENPSIQGGSPGEEALLQQVVGHPDELAHGPRTVSDASIEITEGTRRVPVRWLVLHQTDVLGDRSVETTHAQQRLDVGQRPLTVLGHGQGQTQPTGGRWPPASSDRGRNERR